MFQEISHNLPSDASAYLIGGENLRLKGLREKTNDCDVILADKPSFEAVVKALKLMGYSSIDDEIAMKNNLKNEPTLRFSHPSKVRIDLFMTTVLAGPYISETIKKRALKEDFVGRHILKLGILQNEDIFFLKCVTNRKSDRLDMEVMAKAPSFDWSIVWSEIEKQDKDTGYHMFNTILNNIDLLVEAKNINRPRFYDKLVIRNTDEKICKVVRNGYIYENELIERVVDNKISRKTVENRIGYLHRIGLVKRIHTRTSKVVLRPTKSNVLKYAGRSDFYDRRFVIDYDSLVSRITNLRNKLLLSEKKLLSVLRDCKTN